MTETQNQAPVTRWWWVRHAPVTANEGRVYGKCDWPCDTSDAAAFGRLAALLPDRATWVVSGLQRTHQTAGAIVAAGLPGPRQFPGHDVLVEPDLNEQDFGDWQGMSFADLERSRAEEYHRFWLAPAHEVPPGGESFDQVVGRVQAVITRLNRDLAGRDIIAVAHGGTIRAALAVALGISTEAALAFAIDNIALTRLDHFAADVTGAGHGWRIHTVNRPSIQHG